MNEILKIPYIVHESQMAKYEKLIKRLVGALVLSDVMFAASAAILIFKVTKSES